MNKMTNKIGIAMMMGAAGMGMYLMMNKKMPKMKNVMSSPYTQKKEEKTVNFE